MKTIHVSPNLRDFYAHVQSQKTRLNYQLPAWKKRYFYTHYFPEAFRRIQEHSDRSGHRIVFIDCGGGKTVLSTSRRPAEE